MDGRPRDSGGMGSGGEGRKEERRHAALSWDCARGVHGRLIWIGSVNQSRERMAGLQLREKYWRRNLIDSCIDRVSVRLLSTFTVAKNTSAFRDALAPTDRTWKDCRTWTDRRCRSAPSTIILHQP